MTLLITVAGTGFALSTTDMLISKQVGKKIELVDEKFNKHINFYTGKIRGNITYTGIAQWVSRGEKINLYDIISDSLKKSCARGLEFGPLSMELMVDLNAAIGVPRFRTANGKIIIELHIIGYHEGMDRPFVGVISSLRNSPPWMEKGELEWQYEFPDFNIYFKIAETPELVIGGMHTAVTTREKNKIFNALKNGGDAFNISRLSSKLIEEVSKRTPSVGKRSASVLIPMVGMVDTNLWDKEQDIIVGFLPRTVFPKGESWGPSEFPVTLSILATGYLPKQSLFFKSIAYAEIKKTLRRRIFRHKKGKMIPGLFGLIGLALFGSLPEEYADFGLNSDEGQGDMEEDIMDI